MTAWYNENDPFAAQWLRNLIAAGHLPPGEVDERSIVDVRSAELAGFAHCHFFAGIGGWPYALRLAEWPDDRPVWTGSCPCQPFSAAGKRRGTADERHLWPEFRRFIAEREPAIVFGEQVASKAGREWLAGVRADLEALGYAVGAADLCAASVGAPHIRQRLWWVADAAGGWRGEAKRFVKADQKRSADAKPEWLRELPKGLGRRGRAGGLGHTSGAGLERRPVPERGRSGEWSAWPPGDDAYWLPCTDGKARRTQSGIQPLAHGVPARVGRLRGYGNAINPALAAEFVRAVWTATNSPA